jgi:hypothetical protein
VERVLCLSNTSSVTYKIANLGFTLISTIHYAVWIAVAVIGFGAILITVTVGSWDLLVWLLKEDWRTTSFAIPKWSSIAAVVAFFAGHALSSFGDFWEEIGKRHRFNE